MVTAKKALKAPARTVFLPEPSSSGSVQPFAAPADSPAEPVDASADPALDPDGLPLPADPEPVFGPYVETSPVRWRFDALGRRVLESRDGKFLVQGSLTGAWIPGQANAVGTAPLPPQVQKETRYPRTFAGDNDVAAW